MEEGSSPDSAAKRGNEIQQRGSGAMLSQPSRNNNNNNNVNVITNSNGIKCFILNLGRKQFKPASAVRRFESPLYRHKKYITVLCITVTLIGWQQKIRIIECSFVSKNE
jgi:hypothetical protein